MPLPDGSGVRARRPGRAARPGVESCFPRRALWDSKTGSPASTRVERRLLSRRASRPRRCCLAALFGDLYTMLLWKPKQPKRFLST